jgi:hypothetical protein
LIASELARFRGWQASGGLDFGFQGNFFEDRADADARFDGAGEYNAPAAGMNLPCAAFRFRPAAPGCLDDLFDHFVEGMVVIIEQYDVAGVEKGRSRQFFLGAGFMPVLRTLHRVKKRGV